MMCLGSDWGEPDVGDYTDVDEIEFDEDGNPIDPSEDFEDLEEERLAEEAYERAEKAAEAKLHAYYIFRIKALSISVLHPSKKLAAALSDKGIALIGDLTKRTEDEYKAFLSQENGGLFDELSEKIKKVGSFGMTDEDWEKSVQGERLEIHFDDLHEVLGLDEFNIIRKIYKKVDGYEINEVRDVNGQLLSYFESGRVAIIKEKNTSCCIHKSFYNADGKLVNGQAGWAKFEATVDNHENITGFAYYDENGSLVGGEKGYARSEYTYEQKNLLIARKWYDEKGNLLREWRGSENLITPQTLDTISSESKTEYDSAPDRHFPPEKDDFLEDIPF